MTSAADTAPTTTAARRSLQHAGALLLYAALAIAVLWPALAGDQVVSAAGVFTRSGPFPSDLRERASDSITILSDQMQVFSPWLRLAADSWKRDGRIPLWKSTALCGAPFVGNGQSALFFPTRLLAMVLGAPVWIHTADALAKLVIGAFGAYLLGRHLRLSFLAALACGVIFGFGGFQVVFLQFPLTSVSMLLPWLLLAADAVALQPTAWRVTGLALLAGLQHLGGHAETAFHCQAAAAALGVVRCVSLRHERGGAWRRIAWLAGGLLLGAGLGAIQTLPLLEYMGESDMLRRRAQPAPHLAENARLLSIACVLSALIAAWALRRLARAGTNIALPAVVLFVAVAGTLAAGTASGMFEVWMHLLAPDWYGDIRNYVALGNWVERNGAFAGAALPLVMLGLLAGRPRGPVIAAGVLLALGVAAGFNAPIVSELLERLPVFGLAANIRLLLLALLASAVLAGFGLDALGQLARGSSQRLRLALAVLVPVVAAWGVVAGGVQRGWITSPNLPEQLPGTQRIQAELLPASWDERLVPHLRPLVPQEGPVIPTDEGKAFYGLVTLPGPIAGLRLMYGRDNSSVLGRWLLLQELGYDEHPVPGHPEQIAVIFKAVAPREAFPPERSFVRVWVAFMDGTIGMSPLLSDPNDPGPLWLPFPARPAAPDAWWPLFWLGLATLLAVALLHARGAVLVSLRVVLLALVGASLFGFAAGAIPLVAPALVYPLSPPIRFLQKLAPEGRLLNMYPQSLPPEVPAYYDLRDVRGYDVLYPARIAQLLRAATDVPGADSPVQNLPIRNDPDLRLLGLMSVAMISDFRGAATAAEVAHYKLDPEPWLPRFRIVANPHFLPRARLVAGVAVEPDDDRALELLRSPGFARDRSLVLPSGEPRESAPGSAGFAQITTDRPDVVRVHVQPVSPGHLLLADTFFPGWVASVDGQPREILRANVAFRAVAVAPGDRVVEFLYQPRSVRWGACISLGSGLLLAALCAGSALRRRRSRRAGQPARQAASHQPQSAA